MSHMNRQKMGDERAPMPGRLGDFVRLRNQLSANRSASSISPRTTQVSTRQKSRSKVTFKEHA